MKLNLEPRFTFRQVGDGAAGGAGILTGLGGHVLRKGRLTSVVSVLHVAGLDIQLARQIGMWCI